ncbi:putative ATPase [Geodermatophilus tzadiensis]|uniref:Putative ATPase n=1 Tax=Geodermatophilus tzadiensis TaxID=1137988 RepID=A0A2T0TU15_9ACTN|nr:BTAD domain-containing putative transcriptional regulator [Geodermatophilus tzadiensis]PRY49008.1 putative ATPase [Geodermatophilus tzadiensis]
MDFSVLGPLQVRSGGKAVAVRRGHPRVLLTYLLLHPGEPVPGPLLADRTWNGCPPADAANAVHRMVSYLRRAIGGQEELPLRTTGGGYVLDVPAAAVDCARFSRLVRGAGGEPARTLAALDQALDLWRGDPLADAAGLPWAVPHVTELEELYLQAQERRLTCLLELGRHQEAVPAAQALARTHPLRENLTSSLMLALYRSGRQGDALAAAAALRRTLADELGLDPSPAVLELEHRVLLQDPALSAAAPVAADPRVPGGGLPEPPGAAGVGPPEEAGQRVSGRRAVTSLVGRDAETTAVTAAFEEAGLLTLTGPGGTGKTRLALAVLERGPDRGPEWFADLSGAHDDAAVASVVAAATGTPTAPGSDVVQAVVAHLGNRPGVLVLDTCEHVVGGAATLAVAVLHGCPRVRQLATSRRPLGVTGEVVWPVPPLTLPPVGGAVTTAQIGRAASVELFAQRAAAVQPGFRIDDANAADVAAVCRVLDGLPLAIELAAAHVDVVSPATILERLDDRFALLVSETRDVVARQRTLRAAISSSVDLLTADERALLTRLAVFAGTFDVDAAAAVAGRDPGSPDVEHFRLLASLVRQSLVARAGPDRYRLLDSIRAHAGEVLASAPDAPQVRRRHAQHHLAMAEAGDRQVRTNAQQPWLVLLREVLPDLRAALRWCLDGNAPELGARLVGALAWFWTLEGQLAEARSWLDRAERAEIDDPRVRSRVLLGVGLVAAPLGDLARARDACAAAADLSRAAGDDRGTGDALITLGVALWALGDLDAAAAAHDEAIERLAAEGDSWRRAVAVVLRARTALDRHDPDAGDRTAAAAVAARRSGDAHLEGLASTQRARDALRAGDGPAAACAAQQALEAHRRIGYREGVAAALTLLARARSAEGAAGTATALAEEAMAVATAIEHRGALCHAVEALAAARAAAGDDRDALLLLEVAATDRRARGIPDPPVERELTERLADGLRVRLGPGAEDVRRQATGTTLDDVAAERGARAGRGAVRAGPRSTEDRSGADPGQPAPV